MYFEFEEEEAFYTTTKMLPIALARETLAQENHIHEPVIYYFFIQYPCWARTTEHVELTSIYQNP